MPPQPEYIELACEMLGRNTEPDEEQMLAEVQGLMVRAGYNLYDGPIAAAAISVALVLFRHAKGKEV